MAEPVEVILKLGVDSQGVVQEIDKVKSKYGEVNTEVKKNQEELNKLIAAEKVLLARRAETNNPTIIAQFNEHLKKNKEQIDKITAAQKLNNTELKETAKQSTKTKDELGKAFDTTKVISLRGQLRRMREDLAQATDPAEIQRLAVETGKLQDKLEDAATASRIFSTESKFTSVRNALGDVGAKLLQLDFKGAADSSRLLATASGRITFRDALSGIRSLGQTLFNVGRALLTNPLFLIGAAVTLIIANFDKLKNATGPIGQAFKFIGSIIDGLKNSFFTLTDAIGLTNQAMENFVSKQLSQLDKSFENTQKFAQREIDIRKAAGKETEDLEIKKLQAVIKNSKDQLTLLNKVYKTSDDERRDSLINAALDADTQIKVLEANKQKRIKDNAKKEADEFKKTEQQKIDEAQAEADRLTAVEIEIAKRNLERRIKQADDTAAAGEKALADDINERQRHAGVILQINKASQALQLQSEIDFERERLDFLIFTKGLESQEVINQNNKIIELELKKNAALKEADEQRTKEIIDNSKKITDILISSADKVFAAEISRIDKLTQAQEKRVDDATRLAEKGNAELLELEKKRLEDLNKEKEKFVRAQQALAVIQLVADTAVTISAAAAEGATEGGGIGAGISIAAALVALIAGLAAARTLAGQAAFYEGGYTGDGNPRQESNLLGMRPYKYHRAEFVFDHEKTKKYRNLFQDAHEGKVDLNEINKKASLFDMLKLNDIDLTRDVRIRSISDGAGLEKLHNSMAEMTRAIKGQERTKVVFDENGISIIASHYIEKQNRLNKLAS